MRAFSELERRDAAKCPKKHAVTWPVVRATRASAFIKPLELGDCVEMAPYPVSGTLAMQMQLSWAET